jgi:glycosyltransferase involved in cell wall biosynthesis
VHFQLAGDLKKSLLIIQQLHPHYRVPLFNKLAEYFDLTLAVNENVKHEVVIHYSVVIYELRRVAFFNVIQWGQCTVRPDDFDIVVMMFNIKWLDVWRPFFSKRSSAYVLWGIGVSTEHGFDAITKWDRLRYYCAKKSNALVLYSNYARIKYVNAGIREEKLFVANNTVELNIGRGESDLMRSKILFVGSVTQKKGLEELILAFNDVRSALPDYASIDIVGDGPELKNLKSLITKTLLEDKVTVHGRVIDASQLKVLYSTAIVCISPKQAGLAVLSAMGHGLPFVTRTDSITGGERYNIVNGENGLLYNSEEELKKQLLFIYNNEDKVKEMGHNAAKHYQEFCTMEIMAKSFAKAVNFAYDDEK